MFIDTIILASLLAIMIIDILAVSKIRLNYQKVYHEVRIALMTTIGVTERLSSWNQRTEVHDWKRRSERLVRACGHIYTIVRPGWFDYNNDDEHRIVMLQGDRRHAGTPEDSVISREQIAQVLVTALSNDAAKIKRSNWSQSEEKHSRISLFCLQSCGMIIHKK